MLVKGGPCVVPSQFHITIYPLPIILEVNVIMDIIKVKPSILLTVGDGVMRYGEGRDKGEWTTDTQALIPRNKFGKQHQKR